MPRSQIVRIMPRRREVVRGSSEHVHLSLANKDPRPSMQPEEHSALYKDEPMNQVRTKRFQSCQSLDPGADEHYISVEYAIHWPGSIFLNRQWAQQAIKPAWIIHRRISKSLRSEPTLGLDEDDQDSTAAGQKAETSRRKCY